MSDDTFRMPNAELAKDEAKKRFISKWNKAFPRIVKELNNSGRSSFTMESISSAYSVRHCESLSMKPYEKELVSMLSQFYDISFYTKNEIMGGAEREVLAIQIKMKD